MQKRVVMGGVVVIAVFAAGVWFWKERALAPGVCPSDAKVCADGTAVGRVAPSCEFAPCPNTEFGETELRYRLITYFGKPFFCDPDFYPVAREDEEISATRHFPELRADTGAFETILAHLDMTVKMTYSSEEQLRIWREYKMLRAIRFTPGREEADGSYGFSIRIAEKNTYEGETITGVIQENGGISIRGREPANTTCPICLAGATRIETPTGSTAIRDIRVGDTVFSIHSTGVRTSARVIRIGRTPVSHHRVVHLELADGRELFVSPGHSLVDGRHVGNLRAGDALDGSIVRMTEFIPYEEPFTYDILLEGGAAYSANGIPLHSTLEP